MSFNLEDIQSYAQGIWGPRFEEPERLPIQALVAWDVEDARWVWMTNACNGHTSTQSEAKRLALDSLGVTHAGT